MDNLEMRAHALTMLYLQQMASTGKLQLAPLAYANEYKRVLNQMREMLAHS